MKTYRGLILRLCVVTLTLASTSAAVAQLGGGVGGGGGSLVGGPGRPSVVAGGGDPREDEATALEGKTSETISGILSKISDAQEKKDLVKLGCLNRTLDAAKRLQSVSQAASMQLKEANAKQKPKDAQLAYQKIQFASKSISKVEAEANKCTGTDTETIDTQEQVVSVEESEDVLASKDPTAGRTPAVEGQPDAVNPLKNDPFPSDLFADPADFGLSDVDFTPQQRGETDQFGNDLSGFPDTDSFNNAGTPSVPSAIRPVSPRR
jgi:hypothetical protein